MSARPLVERLGEVVAGHEPNHPILKEVACRYCGGVGGMYGYLITKGYGYIRCDYCEGTGTAPNRLAGAAPQPEGWVPGPGPRGLAAPQEGKE